MSAGGKCCEDKVIGACRAKPDDLGDDQADPVMSGDAVIIQG